MYSRCREILSPLPPPPFPVLGLYILRQLKASRVLNANLYTYELQYINVSKENMLRQVKASIVLNANLYTYELHKCYKGKHVHLEIDLLDHVHLKIYLL